MLTCCQNPWLRKDNKLVEGNIVPSLGGAGGEWKREKEQIQLFDFR